MAQAKGVSPDPVIRDPRSSATLIFANLRPELDAPGAQQFLAGLTDLVDALTAKAANPKPASP